MNKPIPSSPVWELTRPRSPGGGAGSVLSLPIHGGRLRDPLGVAAAISVPCRTRAGPSLLTLIRSHRLLNLQGSSLVQ